MVILPSSYNWNEEVKYWPQIKSAPNGNQGQEIEIMGIQPKVPNSDHQMNNYLCLHNRLK